MNSEVRDLHSPFPYRVNPHVEQARTHLADWVGQVGLVHGESARQRFERADFGWFVSVVYPTASRTHVELMADWFAWLFLVDDQLDDGQFGHNPEHLREVVERMRAVLEADDPETALRAATFGPTAVTSLADLWARTVPDTTAGWRRRFVRHLELCLQTAAVWEAGNRVAGIVPTEESYVVNRRHTGAIYVCMDLIEIVEPVFVPDELFAGPEFTAALDAACNVVCWTNDVYSLDKERSLGEVHNLVLVVEHHRGLAPDKALAHVCAAVDAETDAYLRAEERLLAAHPAHREVLLPYAAGMRTWMRGNLDWSRRTKRYHPSGRADEMRPEEYLEAPLMGAER